MEIFETDDLVTLEDGIEYLVVKEITFKDKKYVCLTEKEDVTKITFHLIEKEEDGTSFVKIDDPDLIVELMKIIHDQVMEGNF